MFDLPPQGRTPPPSPASHDETGRPLTPCAHIGTRSAWTDETNRRERRSPPTCNRTSGHDAPHQRVDRRSFGIEAEWGADDQR
jgi:hypothetical protein